VLLVLSLPCRLLLLVLLLAAALEPRLLLKLPHHRHLLLQHPNWHGLVL
jgi:hypothetical protein